MIRIDHQREKCIGCNYCVEIAPERWRMSRKDGKSVLVGAKQGKIFDSTVVADIEREANLKAAEACPVKIIHVKEVKQP